MKMEEAFKNKFSFILFFWLYWVLGHAGSSLFVLGCGLFSCGVQTLSCGM